jgi:hypothetical protein
MCKCYQDTVLHFTLPKTFHIQYGEVREVIYLSTFSIVMIILNYVGDT